MKKSNWELFFKQEAPHYLENVFTKNTKNEVKFIINELALIKGQKILDIGCGTGRHSIELAKAGFRLTGIDLSKDQLKIARKEAKKSGFDIIFIKGDASKTVLNEKFDHAICLCEGAFSLFEEGVNPVSYHINILKNIRKMLKPGGKFLLNALNGFKFIRESSDKDVRRGVFDPVQIARTTVITLKNHVRIRVKEKGFLPGELKSMLESCGFKVIGIWGGTAGSWHKKPLKLDEFEIMALCKKPA